MTTRAGRGLGLPRVPRTGRWWSVKPQCGVWRLCALCWPKKTAVQQLATGLACAGAGGPGLRHCPAQQHVEPHIPTTAHGPHLIPLTHGAAVMGQHGLVAAAVGSAASVVALSCVLCAACVVLLGVCRLYVCVGGLSVGRCSSPLSRSLRVCMRLRRLPAGPEANSNSACSSRAVPKGRMRMQHTMEGVRGRRAGM